MGRVQFIKVKSDENNLRLDRWFKRNFPMISHAFLEKLLRKGQIRLDGGRVKSNQRILSGQELRIPPLPAQAHRSKAITKKNMDRNFRDSIINSIVYQDNEIIAINKPYGIAVQGGSGIVNHIDSVLDELSFGMPERPRLVHRLDKNTTGILLLGRTAKSASELSLAFRQNNIKKIYWAIVVGCPDTIEGQVDAPLRKFNLSGEEKTHVDTENGKPALTLYKVIASASNKVSWLDLRPQSGRTHQIRAHCSFIGTPILGDRKYGSKTFFISDLPDSRKLHLFSRGIKLSRINQKDLEIYAPVPSYIDNTIKFFGFDYSDAEKFS